MTRAPAHEARVHAWTRARALIALTLGAGLSLAGGCRLQISPERVFRDREGQVYPAPGADVQPLRAAKKNELTVGLLRPRLLGVDEAEKDLVRELGDPKEVGQDLADALLEAKIWKEVHYPHRDEKVDVILEPVYRATLVKNRGTNALKVLPGIVFPWIDGFGFDYDHAFALELRVRDAGQEGRLCDTFRTESALTAERYPSVLWFLGLHAGLIILTIFESVTTDAIAEPLAAKDAAISTRAAVAWLAKEFEPASRSCPAHPDLKANTGKFCIVCRANLRYPILSRTEGRAPASPPRTPPPSTVPPTQSPKTPPPK